MRGGSTLKEGEGYGAVHLREGRRAPHLPCAPDLGAPGASITRPPFSRLCPQNKAKGSLGTLCCMAGSPLARCQQSVRIEQSQWARSRDVQGAGLPLMLPGWRSASRRAWWACSAGPCWLLCTGIRVGGGPALNSNIWSNSLATGCPTWATHA